MKKNSSVIKYVLSPFRNIHFIVMLIMTLFLCYYSKIVGACAIAVLIILFIHNRTLDRRSARYLIKYIEDLSTEMGETMVSAVSHNPLPLCMVNSSGALLWFNKRFSAIYPNAAIMSQITDLTGVKTSVIFPAENEEPKSDDYGNEIKAVANDKTYKVVISAIVDNDEEGVRTAMLHFVDITPYDTLRVKYKKEKNCIAIINVDNYDELLASISEDKKVEVTSAIESKIRKWAKLNNGAIVSYSAWQYFMVFTSDVMELMERNKFSVLDEVRELDTSIDFPASLTIGIGCDGESPAENHQFAKSAMELAMGRGGDQVVVKKQNHVEYYGGKLQTVEKRNKGKSRILAHALNQLIDQCDKVIIMGHKIPDMDALGSSLGVARLAKIREKDDYIVVGNTTAVDILYKEAQNADIYNFISEDVANDIIDEESLLIVVDVNKPSLVEAPSLLKKTQKIVVIDHHRRGEEIIEAPTLSYIESYASSASELVAELLEYSSDKKVVTKLEAEALLSGIAVDTKNFSVKTGVRTFQAAAWLRRQGADTGEVRGFFKTNMDLVKARASIISNTRMVTEGIVIAYCEGKRKNISVLIATAADEILNIKGVNASFVLGEGEDGLVRVSARSLGDINVQLYMEKLGGGGHFTTAGVQLDMPLADAVKAVENVILTPVD